MERCVRSSQTSPAFLSVATTRVHATGVPDEFWSTILGRGPAAPEVGAEPDLPSGALRVPLGNLCEAGLFETHDRRCRSGRRPRVEELLAGPGAVTGRVTARQGEWKRAR